MGAPRSRQLGRREELERVAGAAAVRTRPEEEPQPALVIEQRGGGAVTAAEEVALVLPALGKGCGPVELHAPGGDRLGQHVDLAAVLEHERVGEVVRALERDRRRTD